jgi:glucose-6-phosphate 1-dehydrogenase
MPAIDSCQPQVIRALEKDGWRIEGMNIHLRHKKRYVFVDIQATHIANGSSRQILLAEVKCFANPLEATQDLYSAIGQYAIYRAMLEQKNNTQSLYLAIPTHAYRHLFDDVVQQAMSYVKMKLIVVDLDQEEIVEWKE